MSASDDFQRALDDDREAVIAALESRLTGEEAERATALVREAFAQLRTPIHPRHRGRAPVADAIARAVNGEVRALELRGVLASPTASAELPHFLRFAATFRERVPTRLALLLVRWENLDEPAGDAAFAELAEALGRALRAAGWGDEALAFADVRTAQPSAPPITAPADFAAAWHAVVTAAGEGSANDQRLAHDVAWIVSFYERQHSLSKHGGRQPLFDLAVRRAIGGRLSIPRERVAPLLVTSELHHRFLPCYATTVPILDIDVE